jgi:energy-coupling factor transporter transmembrane protein EcfT
MALLLGFYQTEKFWATNNIPQTLLFYSIHALISLTIPWFTIGEHVSSITRQCFVAAIYQLAYVSVFPPPLVHALISAYFMAVYFLFRTHAFNMLASDH